MKKKIVLLGSTGSIGTQSLEVIRAQGYEVLGLAAGSNDAVLLEQIEEFHPAAAALADEAACERLRAALAGRADAPRLLCGAQGIEELARMPGADIVLNAVVGIAGLGEIGRAHV